MSAPADDLPQRAAAAGLALGRYEHPPGDSFDRAIAITLHVRALAEQHGRDAAEIAHLALLHVEHQGGPSHG